MGEKIIYLINFEFKWYEYFLKAPYKGHTCLMLGLGTHVLSFPLFVSHTMKFKSEAELSGVDLPSICLK